MKVININTGILITIGNSQVSLTHDEASELEVELREQRLSKLSKPERVEYELANLRLASRP